MNDTPPPVPRPGDFQLAPPPPEAPPKPRRKGLWIGIGLGGLLIVLCLVAGVVLVGTGLYMGVRGTPDRYHDAMRPDQVMPADAAKVGASGGTAEVSCREDQRPKAYQHECVWDGASLDSGQTSSLWVIITVFPTEKQEMVSGTVAAAAAVAVTRKALKDVRTLTGVGDLAYVGWCVSPWEARVVFVKGNAAVVVDYGLDPALDGSKPADWSANAVTVARRLAAVM
ncbi:hypothetical protein [Fodinicola acaciae]|uniref:hypothetical protein n=1 Tax=Fodinicola acaciae TaxID=2681555 RepID=UPI001FE3DE9D|nr:hypothetical protein [Fodinicola acaciae]